MTTNAYIQLTTSSGSPSYKFPVIFGGYNVVQSKAQTENETIGGIDVAMGAIHEVHEYYIQVRGGRMLEEVQVVDNDYGILSDLQDFYQLNDPNASPSNVLTLTDHYGQNHQAYFVGEFSLQPVITIIEGGGAIYFIPCRFRIIPT